MNYRLFIMLASGFVAGFGLMLESIEIEHPEEEIYWDTPPYLSRLDSQEIAKTRYVYHRRLGDFIGNLIIPLNQMPTVEGFAKIYRKCLLNYEGREELLKVIIPTLNCFWNDVIFLSPVHPHKHYEEFQKIGFVFPKRQFYKIPIDILKNKRLTVWKWLSYKKYPKGDPIHRAIDSYCSFDFLHYQEMQELPDDTKEFYRDNFSPDHPEILPNRFWYRIPHILCQDPIDISDERITLIDWEDPIEE